jgi:type IV secretion system protein TrbG
MGAKAMIKLVWVGALAFAASASAQMVPAIEQGAPLVTAMSAPSDAASINEKERKSLEIAREWKNNPDKPRRSADGGAVYLYGATLPTLICTTLQVCAIRLQPGEIVNDEPHVGDRVRWIVRPSMIGGGPSAITAIMVKPTESGIVTNMIINTNRRSYNIKLMATRHEWLPYISFDYPDDQEREWKNYQISRERAEYGSTLPGGQNIANLDFDYQLSGDNPKWKPQRVYYDRNSKKTIIQFPSNDFGDDAPVLVVLGKGKHLWSGTTEKIVNYRRWGNDSFMVDQAIEEAALISGVGNQQTKVIITRGKGK